MRTKKKYSPTWPVFVGMGALLVEGVLLGVAGVQALEAARWEPLPVEPPVVETVATPEPVVLTEVVEEAPELANLGEFKITHYCACAKCCGEWADGITFTGTTATAGRTIAVDPNVIPLGSVVVVDGVEYVAEDIGGAIKGNRIDIFMDSHDAALTGGVKTAEVFMEVDA